VLSLSLLLAADRSFYSLFFPSFPPSLSVCPSLFVFSFGRSLARVGTLSQRVQVDGV